MAAPAFPGTRIRNVGLPDLVVADGRVGAILDDDQHRRGCRCRRRYRPTPVPAKEDRGAVDERVAL